MNTGVRSRALNFQIAAARLHQRVGLPGMLGLGLLLVAALSLSLAWRQHQRLDRDAHTADQRASIDRLPARNEPAPQPPRTSASLPPASDIPLLLTRIQRAALDAGLGWPRADYRFNPATDEAPASLEVKCALKGPYLAIRRFVTSILQDSPTLTLREFSLSRAHADAADVEAKLSIVVYLASSVAPVAGASR